jgi:Protein of unknown function (DUF1351).
MTEKKAETEELDFKDLEEFKFEKPEIAQDNTLVVQSNADTLAGKIKAIVGRYKGVELTESNVGYVKTLKQHFVSLRTSIERERKEWQKCYIDPAKNTIKAVCDDLQKIVSEGESAITEQLDAYDQKRKDELTEVLKQYVAGSVAKHGLRDDFAQMVVIKEKYYNKTQNEDDSADDIEAQAVEAEKKQKEYDAGLELIKAECEGSTLVPETYIKQLQYKSAMELVLEIKADKKRSAEILAELEAKKAEGRKIEIGEPLDSGIKDLIEKEVKPQGKEEGRFRTRRIEITYRADFGEKMMEFFEENGVQVKFLKAQA